MSAKLQPSCSNFANTVLAANIDSRGSLKLNLRGEVAARYSQQEGRFKPDSSGLVSVLPDLHPFSSIDHLDTQIETRKCN